MRFAASWPEISDLIVDIDPHSLERRPVSKASVVDRLRSAGSLGGARIVEGLLDRDGILEPSGVDALLVRVHCELQLLNEEFHHGLRIREIVAPFIAAFRCAGIAPPYRVVDIGCGIAYIVRYLGLKGDLGPDVELVGVDHNPALIDHARALAAEEGADVRLLQADAFMLEPPATLLMSTGVLHHFRGDSLSRFLARHENSSTVAFVHTDFQPSFFTPFGAWLFHYVRMREPLSLHDGQLSAARAHPAEVVLQATKMGAPGFRAGMYSTRLFGLPRVFHSLVGVRPDFASYFLDALGERRHRMGPLR
jgi:SAM-dependent methyltransferase